MKKFDGLWMRGILGLGVSVLIIVGTSLVYPVSGANFPGHVLTWAMAGIIGLMITLSSVDAADNWAGSATESGDKMTEPVRKRTTAGSGIIEGLQTLTHPGRGSLLSHESGQSELMKIKHSSGIVTAQRGFHRPVEKERRACVRFASKNPLCTLGTLDEDGITPRVRTMFLWRADRSGFYFVLFSSKKVSRQVKAHPIVEVCFQNHPTDLMESRQLRLSGPLHLLHNRKLEREAASERSVLNLLAGDDQGNHLEVHLLSKYEVRFWSMNKAVHQPTEHPLAV